MLKKMTKDRLKIFLIFSLILVAIIGVSAVSATDVNDTTQTADISSDNTQISDTQITDTATDNNVDHKILKTEKKADNTKTAKTKTTEKTIKKDAESTFTDLKSTIDTASNSSTIELSQDYTKATSEDIITLDKSLTIDGKGHTITSANGSFYISAGTNTTFKNIIFTGNNADKPVIDAYGNTTCINVTFKDNNNTGYSVAAVMEVESGSYVTILNSTVTNNRATAGVFNTWSQANVIVDNSNFTDSNTANGVFQIRGRNNVSVTNSRFINNYASSWGGVINSKAGYLYVNNSYFERNTAGSGGSVIALRGNGENIIENSQFISNKVNGTRAVYGGAIYVDDDVVLHNNTMRGNTARNGSNICIRSSIIAPVLLKINDARAVEDESFQINALVTDDANNVITGGTLTIEINGNNYTSYVDEGKATFTLNGGVEPGNYTLNGSYDGVAEGNLTVTTGNLEIIPSTVLKYKNLQGFVDNATEGSTITLTDLVKRGSSEDNVTINKTVTIDANGFNINANSGCIFYVNNGATLTLKNAVIANATGIQGIVANVTNGNLVLDNVTIVDNVAQNYGSSMVGSLIYIENNAILTMNNVLVENNTEAVLNIKGNATLNNTVLRSNKGSTSWNSNNQGWIVLSGKLSIYNSLFENNVGKLAGIYGTAQRYPMLVDNSTFINNTVSTGSGAAIQNGNDLNITNSRFIANKATGYGKDGGAIYSTGKVVIKNSTFINNTATGEGSIIANGYGGSFNITNSILVSNTTRSALYNGNENYATQVANYNWWGTNNNPKNYVKSNQYYDDWEEDFIDCQAITVNNWIVMNTTIIPEENNSYGDTITVKTTFNQCTDSTGAVSTLENSIPDGLEVVYSSNRNTFSQNATVTLNGETTNNYTIKSQNYVISVTQGNQTNTISAVVIMPEPKTIILTDETYSQYFNDEGRLIESMVLPNSELQFSGVFNNRNMTIDLPVNITTHTTQAVLNNCTITVVKDGMYTNITDIIMNNTDYSETLINLVNATNVQVKNTTLYQYNTNQSTHAIDISYADNIIIDSNNIVTVGPSKNVEYDANYVAQVVTSSITGFNASSNIIRNNRIITNYTGEAESFGTVEGIAFTGVDSYDWTTYERLVAESSDNVVTNNTVITESNNYAYGISFTGAVNENNITYNNVTTISTTYYANGIQLGGPAENNIISYNTVNAEAQNVTYGLYISTNNMGTVTDNTVTYNNVTANSSSIYLIELYGVADNNISYNQLTGNNNYVLGIATYNAKNNDISYNNMTLIGDMQNDPVSMDAITVETTGIKLTGRSSYASSSNTITYNNITAITPSADTYAINATMGSGHNISNNYLVSTGKSGNSAVHTTSGNTVKDNIPDKIGTTITMDEVEGIINENVVITAKITADDYKDVTGVIKFTDSEGNELGTVDITNGTAVLNKVFQKEDIVDITATFAGNDTYANSSTTTKVTINKINTTITMDSVEGYVTENIAIIANVIGNDGNNVDGTITFTDANGNELGTVDVINGSATLNKVFMADVTTDITATYNGNDLYNISSTTTKLEIKKLVTIVTVDEINAKEGDTINISATVTDNLNNVINGGKVVFKVDGRSIRDTNGKVIYADVIDGKAVIENFVVPYGWTSGSTISSLYTGNEVHELTRSTTSTMDISKRTATLELSDITAKTGETVKLTVNVKDSISVNSGKVVFKVNGRSIRDTNGNVIYADVNNGVASLDYTIPDYYNVQDYKVSCVFINDEYDRADATGTLTITQN